MKKLILNFASNVLSFSDMTMIKGGYDDGPAGEKKCEKQCDVPKADGTGTFKSGCYADTKSNCICLHRPNNSQC